MTVEFDFSEAKAQQAAFSTEDISKIPKKSQMQQEKIWKAWEIFSTGLRDAFDKDQIWFDLLNHDKVAMAWIRTFLKQFFKNNKKKILTIGPEENKTVPRIQSGGVYQEYWCALINVVDKKYMQPRRKANSRDANASYWDLRCNPADPGSKSKPAYQITKWLPELVLELGGSLGQMFVKREATIEDLTEMISTLWTRSSDVVCQPRHRVDFHLAVLIGGIGGWRPQEVLQIKYEDVEIGWLRNPEDPLKPFIVCNITIHHVKMGQKIRADQVEVLTFWLARIPDAYYCALTKIVIQALDDNAFEEDYKSIDQVINRAWEHDPRVHFIPARWKASVLKQEIYDMKYGNFLGIWKRIMCVMGLDAGNQLKPYASRVGAGGRLLGALQSAMSNYILGHSTKVHKRSYQPRTVPDLQGIAFGQQADGAMKILALTKTAFLRKDERAPIHITAKKWQGLEERDDIKALRAQLHPSLPGPERKRIFGEIAWIKKKLENDLREESREEYFKEARVLQEKGLTTDHLYDYEAKDPHKRKHQASSDSASLIGRLLVQDSSSPEVHIQMLYYLEGRDLDGPADRPERQTEKPRCLLGCGVFANKDALTRHLESRQHDSSFQKPLACPECKMYVSAGREFWYSHIIHYHDKIHAPSASRKAVCFLCDKSFTSRGFSNHINVHVRDGQFLKPFPCPKCQQDQKVDRMIQDLGDWEEHRWTHLSQTSKKECTWIYPPGTPIPRKRPPVNDSSDPIFGGGPMKKPKNEDYQHNETSSEEDSDKGMLALFENDEFFVTGRDEDYDDFEFP